MRSWLLMRIVLLDAELTSSARRGCRMRSRLRDETTQCALAHVVRGHTPCHPLSWRLTNIKRRSNETKRVIAINSVLRRPWRA